MSEPRPKPSKKTHQTNSSSWYCFDRSSQMAGGLPRRVKKVPAGHSAQSRVFEPSPVTNGGAGEGGDSMGWRLHGGWRLQWMAPRWMARLIGLRVSWSSGHVPSTSTMYASRESKSPTLQTRGHATHISMDNLREYTWTCNKHARTFQHVASRAGEPLWRASFRCAGANKRKMVLYKLGRLHIPLS